MTRIVPLGDVADVNPRLPKALAANGQTRVSFVPMAGLSEEGRITNADERLLIDVVKGYTYFKRGDVLVAKITPCMENGKVAVADSLPHAIGFGSTEFHVLRPGPELHAPYLFYMIWNPAFRFVAARNMTGTAGQKRVPRDFVERYKIPLPPLAEQRRIAAILDRADAIRRKRREAIGLLEELLCSAFLEMFGDNKGNSQFVSLIEVAASVRGAFVNGPFGSDLLKSELKSEGVPVIYIRDIRSGRYVRVSTVCVTPAKAQQLDVCRVEPGDVLVAKVGDPPGVAALYPNGEPLGVVTQDVIRIRIDERVASPEYVVAYLNSPTGRWKLRSITVEATRARFALGAFKQMLIDLPSIDEQRVFSDLVQLHEEALRHRAVAVQLQEQVFNSLAQRAFRGEL